jgi:hypothetical protein
MSNLNGIYEIAYGIFGRFNLCPEGNSALL